MKEQDNILLFQQAEVVTMKEIGLVVVEDTEKIFEEVVEEAVLRDSVRLLWLLQKGLLKNA